MHIVYAQENLPHRFTKSLFLCGPSRRPGQEEIVPWRKDALQILQDKGYDGIVFVPEPPGFVFPEKDFDHAAQIEWEQNCLVMADCLLFYVPRDLSRDKHDNIKLGAFTTNIEWGMYCNSGKVVLAYPEDAEKMAYMQFQADKYNTPTGHTLTEGIEMALDMLSKN